ncbi:MAG: mechanosensitive ion channel family protein [Chloroflexi bacterium]|nr:mechanosensitive ion channel family protein [Chloroflexota bacterium]
MHFVGLNLVLPEWLNWAATPLGTLLANLLAWIVIALIVYYALIGITWRIARRSRLRIDDLIVGILRRPLLVMLLGYGLISAFNTAYSELPFTETLRRLYNGVAIVVGAVVAWRILREILIASLRPVVMESTSQADDVIIPILSRIGPVILTIAVANAVVATLGGSLSALLASLGLLGLVLGYLFQEPLQGLFSGTYMALDDPFHEEDLLILEDGTTCQVRKVGVRVTQLYDVKRHVLLFLPNAKLAANKIINLIKPSVELRTVLPITIDRNVGCHAAIALLIEACNSHENILGEWSQKEPAIRRRMADYQQQCEELLCLPDPTLGQQSRIFWLKDRLARLEGELIRLQVEQGLRARSEAFSGALLDAYRYFSSLEETGRVLEEWPSVRERLGQLMDQFDDLIEQITVWLYLVRVIEAELTDASYEASIAQFVKRDLLHDGRLTLEELAFCRAPGAPMQPMVRREEVREGRPFNLQPERSLDYTQFRDHATYADYRRMYTIWHRNIVFVYRALYRLYHLRPDDERSVNLAQRLHDIERYFSESFLLRVSHWQLPTPKLLEITDTKLRFELAFFVDDVVREHFQRSERVTTELQLEIQRVLQKCV